MGGWKARDDAIDLGEPLAGLVGGCLLILAALLVRSRWRHIGWGLGIAVRLLVGGQVLGVVTGPASGETEPVGWWWAVAAPGKDF